MLLIYTSAFLLGTLICYLGHNIIASAVIIALAIFLYVVDFINTKRIITIRGLFAIGFIGGFGVSLLKLSNLSQKYSVMTFLVVFVAYFAIYFGVYLASRKEIRYKVKKERLDGSSGIIMSHEVLLILLFLLTLISFVAEVWILGFIPMFTKDTPHAYSTFHVFGLHYITTLYAFIPCIAISNYFIYDDKKRAIGFILLSYIYVVILAMLMVSRSQLIISVVLSVFLLLIHRKDEAILFFKDKNDNAKIKKIASIVILVIIFILIYIFITISRSHDIAYLNGIFDMKDKNMPIFITQPYMYIAHNFENLNYMINHTFRWTFGRRTLYPFFTLTLIKKFFPIVVDSPFYVIKQELSTVTLVYDFYYDFGLVGVLIFCFIIGYVGKLIEDMAYFRLTPGGFYKNNYIAIVFALYAYYMFFSFFQSYFSLTDTWVHLIFLGFISLTMRTKNKKA